MAYIVVLQGTGEAGSNYKGIRTIKVYSDRESFEEKLNAGEIGDTVVAQGVTEKEAKRRFDEVSLKTYLDAAYAAATENGYLDLDTYNLMLKEVFVRLRERYR